MDEVKDILNEMDEIAEGVMRVHMIRGRQLRDCIQRLRWLRIDEALAKREGGDDAVQ